MNKRLRKFVIPGVILSVLLTYSLYSLGLIEVEDQKTTSDQIVESILPEKQKRTLASVNEQNDKNTLNFDCAKEFAKSDEGPPNHVKSFSQNVVRLKLENCDSDLFVKKIEIKNETNNYTAQIFRVKKNLGQSDFIQLKKGRNRINLIFSLNKGHDKLRFIDIDRTQ